MKTTLAVGLLIFAIVAFFLIGRVQANHARAATVLSANAIEEANRAVDQELEREKAGPAAARDRTVFLARQKSILLAAKSKSPAPYTPRPSEPAPGPVTQPTPQAANSMQYIVTGVVGLLAIFLIVSPSKQQDDESRKWAFGALGTIVGFWLKS